MTESDIAAACDALAVALGYSPEKYEQRRASRIHEGLPDRRYVHRRGARVWVELKAPTGKLTAAQHAWLRGEWAVGSHAACVDSPDVLRRILVALGRDAGRGEALRICQEVTELVARRGYRTVAA